MEEHDTVPRQSEAEQDKQKSKSQTSWKSLVCEYVKLILDSRLFWLRQTWASTHAVCVDVWGSVWAAVYIKIQNEYHKVAVGYITPPTFLEHSSLNTIFFFAHVVF